MYVLFSAVSISTPNGSFSTCSLFKKHYWCLLLCVVYVLCTKPARKVTHCPSPLSGNLFSADFLSSFNFKQKELFSN